MAANKYKATEVVAQEAGPGDLLDALVAMAGDTSMFTASAMAISTCWPWPVRRWW